MAIYVKSESFSYAEETGVCGHGARIDVSKSAVFSTARDVKLPKRKVHNNNQKNYFQRDNNLGLRGVSIVFFIGIAQWFWIDFMFSHLGLSLDNLLCIGSHACVQNLRFCRDA